MTLEESAMGAVLPWNSLYREDRRSYETLPQQEIDICLLCPLHATSCDKCDGERNVTTIGRPKANLDTELLRNMMRLRRTNKEMCAALNISEPTLIKAKKKILQEESK